MRNVSVLTLLLAFLANPAAAQAEERTTKPPPNLDAVFRVEVSGEGAIDFRFETSGASVQTFESTEYHYALLDKNGVQVSAKLADKALQYLGTAIHNTELPKDKRSVSDYSDYMIDLKSLHSGDEYYLVVSLRNLTGLARFKVP